MFTFIKSVFSEDGQGSYSRTASFSIVLAVIAWVSFIVIKTHALPDLTGAAFFLSTGIAVNYGVNKTPDVLGSVATLFQAYKGKPSV